MKSWAPTAGGGLDLGIGGVGSGVGDVVPDGAGEQERLLGHEPQLGAERLEVQVGERLAVDQHPPVGGVVEAGGQLDQRRLPGPGLADERHGLPRRHRQRHVGERRVRLAGVGEVDVVEPDARRAAGGRRPGGRLWATDTGMASRSGDAVHRHLALLVGVEHLRQLLDRGEHRGEVEHEGEQVADLEGAVAHQAGAGPQHEHGGHRRQQLDEREVGRGDERGVDAGARCWPATVRKPSMLRCSRVKACATRMPDMLSARLALTAAMRSRTSP